MTVAKRKTIRNQSPRIDVKVTRLVAGDEHLQLIVEALAEVGIAYLHARLAPARPVRSPHGKGENDGVA